MVMKRTLTAPVRNRTPVVLPLAITASGVDWGKINANFVGANTAIPINLTYKEAQQESAQS
jgi:hypothetical protein